MAVQHATAEYTSRERKGETHAALTLSLLQGSCVQALHTSQTETVYAAPLFTRCAVCGHGGMPSTTGPPATCKEGCILPVISSPDVCCKRIQTQEEVPQHIHNVNCAGVHIFTVSDVQSLDISKRILLYYSYARGQGSHLNASRVESCPPPLWRC